MLSIIVIVNHQKNKKIKIAHWAYNRNWHSFFGREETQACAITSHSMVHILKKKKHVESTSNLKYFSLFDKIFY